MSGTGWEIVDPRDAGPNERDRPPGEGSPRGSGEEADSLLRRSRGAGGVMVIGDPSRGAAGASSAARGSHGGTGGSSNSNSTVSDYGVLLHGSNYTDDPEGPFPTEFPARPSTELGFIGDRRGVLIHPSELLRMDAEREEHQHLMRNEPPEQYSPLLPPAPLDPDRTALFSSSQKPSSMSIAFMI